MADAALVWFEDEACRDVACAGGKGASLAAMTALGLPVPPGFVVASWVLERSVDADELRRLAVAADHVGSQAVRGGAEPPPGGVLAAYPGPGRPLLAGP